MDGYFQSPRYFDRYREELIQQFTPNFTVSDETKYYLERICSTNSVFVHVRRGDYVVANLGVSMEYYDLSIAYMSTHTDSPHYFIFSDDIEWVKENLKIQGKVTFIERNEEVHPFEDIWLMKHCKHNVIANSTFSWWGAYLNENPDKLTIAPGLMKITNNRDCFPDTWIVL